MSEQREIEPSEIKNALKKGGLDAVEELFYPGERFKSSIRKSNYPLPEGSGRDFWPAIKREEVFCYDRRRLGVWCRVKLYADNIYIGTINSVRRGLLDTYYRTHDGEEFAHWGAGSGAETYLLEKYWRYGNPPKPLTFINKVLDFFVFLTGF